MSADVPLGQPGREVERWLLWLPLVAIQVFLGVTVLLFFKGPYVWPVKNLDYMSFLLVGYHCALLAGFALGLGRKGSEYGECVGMRQENWVVFIGAGLATIGTLLVTKGVTAGELDPSVLANPAQAYVQYQSGVDGAREAQPPLVAIFKTISAPFVVCLIPILIIRWHALKPIVRVVGALGMAVVLLGYLITGRNKGLIDLALVIPWLLLIRSFRLSKASTMRQVSNSMSAFGILVIIAGAYFATAISGRASGNIDAGLVAPVMGGIQTDESWLLLKAAPDAFKPIVRSGAFYLSHGYFGLYLASQKPFVWTKGLGHSAYLQAMARRGVGEVPELENSFVSRIDSEDGWSSTVLWSTSYSWFASDLTFPGVTIVMFLLGVTLAQSWRDCLCSKSMWSIVVVSQLMLFVFYIPGGNAVLASPEGYVGLFVSLVCWIFELNRRGVRR